MYGLSGRELRFALVISSVHFVQHFFSRLIPPLIPVLVVALEYPLWQLGLLVSIITLGSGLSQAPWGVLSDRYDRVYMVPTGLGVAAASYVLFAAAPTVASGLPSIAVRGYAFEGEFIVMCLAMFLIGASTAVVHPTGYPMITANVSEGNKGKILGAFGSSSKFGDATAPALVGILILVLLWDRVVVLLGVLGVGYAAFLFFLLYTGDIDTMPAGSSDDSNESPSALSRSEQDNRTFLYPLLVMYVFFVTKMFAGRGVNTFIPAFLVGVYAYTFEILEFSIEPESVANFYFTALLLVAGITQLWLGGATDRYDPRSVLLACVGVATMSILGLAIFDLSPPFLLLVLLLLGAGLWGVNPARDAIVSEITPAEREGRTFGYLWTSVHLTGAAIPVLVGYLLETVGFREGFMILAAGTILAGLSVSLLYSDRVYLGQSTRGQRAGE